VVPGMNTMGSVSVYLTRSRQMIIICIIYVGNIVQYSLKGSACSATPLCQAHLAQVDPT
jgi:hypothetical protein